MLCSTKYFFFFCAAVLHMWYEVLRLLKFHLALLSNRIALQCLSLDIKNKDHPLNFSSVSVRFWTKTIFNGDVFRWKAFKLNHPFCVGKEMLWIFCPNVEIRRHVWWRAGVQIPVEMTPTALRASTCYWIIFGPCLCFFKAVIALGCIDKA